VPDRPADAHKGTFGTVIIVGGSPAMMGAPALCAAAALRSGAGLVKIATAPIVLAVALAVEPGATGIPLDDLSDDADASAGRIDEADPDASAVLAVGPGLGRTAGAGRLVMRLLEAGGRAVVLDADGLNHLAATGKAALRPPKTGPLVLTPHPGEFARLAKPLGITHSPTDPNTRPAAAAALAQAHGAVVLLKGPHTVVTDGHRLYVNQTGNPALATAGSGDVLTGLIAALIAQHLQPFDAAALAAHLHGLAADLWSGQHGPSGLTARDLANLLPDAFNQRRGPATRRYQ